MFLRSVRHAGCVIRQQSCANGVRGTVLARPVAMLQQQNRKARHRSETGGLLKCGQKHKGKDLNNFHQLSHVEIDVMQCHAPFHPIYPIQIRPPIAYRAQQAQFSKFLPSGSAQSSPTAAITSD